MLIFRLMNLFFRFISAATCVAYRYTNINRRVRNTLIFKHENMQRESSTTAGHGGAYNYNTPSSPPSLLSQPNAFNLTSLYSSILFPQNQNSQSLIDQHYHEDLMDRHNRVLSQLLEAEKKTLALRQENINLKMANFNLNNQLSLLLKASSSDYGPVLDLDSVVDGIRRMHIGVGEEETSSDGHSWEDLVADRHLSPTSVMDSGRAEGVNRVLLPKSISVRSNGYLKTIHAGGGSRPQTSTKSVHTAVHISFTLFSHFFPLTNSII